MRCGGVAVWVASRHRPSYDSRWERLPAMAGEKDDMSNGISALLLCASAALACMSAVAEETAPAPTRMLKSDYRIGMDKLAADYRAAKRVCEAKKGPEERACSKDAEATHEKAEKDLRAVFYGPVRD